MLKRLLHTLALGLMVATSFVGHADSFAPLPAELDGSMMPLPMDRGVTLALPDTLKPVYMAYVSRHGARYLSSAKKLAPLYEALGIHGVSTGDAVDAKNRVRTAAEGNLSETGMAFVSLLDEIESRNEGNWGQLTPIGESEQRFMGNSIYAKLTPLHAKGACVHSIASYVPRCVMTMYLCTAELNRRNDWARLSSDAGHQYDSLLRCFETDKAYAEFRSRGDWKAVYENFVRRHVSPGPAARLFRVTSLNEDQLRELTMAMYEVLEANRAAGLPAPDTRWMTAGDYHACWEADNLRHYLRNCVSPISTLAAHATAPLAFELIEKIDRASASAEPQPAMNGYFGHAETLLPLFSLLRIQGCYAMPLDYDDLAKTWKMQDIVPLGASLMILLSRGQSGADYVSLVLNDVPVDPMPGHKTFVAWPELRRYWLDLTEGYGIAIPARIATR